MTASVLLIMDWPSLIPMWNTWFSGRKILEMLYIFFSDKTYVEIYIVREILFWILGPQDIFLFIFACLMTWGQNPLKKYTLTIVYCKMYSLVTVAVIKKSWYKLLRQEKMFIQLTISSYISTFRVNQGRDMMTLISPVHKQKAYMRVSVQLFLSTHSVQNTVHNMVLPTFKVDVSQLSKLRKSVTNIPITQNNSDNFSLVSLHRNTVMKCP